MADARGYDERVMDQIRNARAYRVLDDATHQAYDINPLCGDEMTVYVREQNVAQLAISVPAFSAALLKHAEPPAAADDDPMRQALLKTVRDLPLRTPCAALPWAILAAALAASTETASVQV